LATTPGSGSLSPNFESLPPPPTDDELSSLLRSIHLYNSLRQTEVKLKTWRGHGETVGKLAVAKEMGLEGGLGELEEIR